MRYSGSDQHVSGKCYRLTGHFLGHTWDPLCVLIKVLEGALKTALQQLLGPLASETSFLHSCSGHTVGYLSYTLPDCYSYFSRREIGVCTCVLSTVRTVGNDLSPVFPHPFLSQARTLCTVDKKRNHSWVFKLEMGRKPIFNSIEIGGEPKPTIAYLWL